MNVDCYSCERRQTAKIEIDDYSWLAPNQKCMVGPTEATRLIHSRSAANPKELLNANEPQRW